MCLSVELGYLVGTVLLAVEDGRYSVAGNY